MARNDLENSNQDNSIPIAAAAGPGHRIREIRQDLRRRHHIHTGHQLAHTAAHGPTMPAPLLPATSDEHQTRLYTRSRADRRECFAAARETIATSPYTWKDLSADGVRDWVEESVGDDALVAAALESLGSSPRRSTHIGEVHSGKDV